MSLVEKSPAKGSSLGPLPRLRLYSSPRLYGRTLYTAITGKTKRGDDVAVLEAEIRRRLGIKHGIAMPMARVGIYLAVKHTIKPGQKVILSPYTIADVINMVICAGGIPTFADIDRKTCNLDPKNVAPLIDGDTGAVLVTHFYGQVADMPALQRVCAPRGIPIIEDAAQAFGGRAGNWPAGTVGHAGIYSFGMYKNVNAFYGGMLVTDDDALAQALRSEMAAWPYQSLRGLVAKMGAAVQIELVTWPPVFRLFFFRLFRWAYLNQIDAINDRLKIDVDPKLKTSLPESYQSQLTPLQARLILSQLAKVDDHAASRLESARLYYQGLADIEELIVAPLCEDRQHIYWYYPIQHADRRALVSHVMRAGRDITPSYHKNCAALPCFSQFARSCPNAQATADQLIYLPTYPRYAKAEVAKTVRAIRSFFGR